MIGLFGGEFGSTNASTIGANTLSGTCGGNGSERVYIWTTAAPNVRVSVDTCGSATNFDTVLYVRRGSCTGPQVACNDNHPDKPVCFFRDSDSYLEFLPTPNTIYYIFVDGKTGGGDFRLNVTCQSCVQ